MDERELAREQVETMALEMAENIAKVAASWGDEVLPTMEAFAQASQEMMVVMSEAVEAIQALHSMLDLLPFPPTRWQRVKAHIKYFFWIENETDWIIVNVY